MKRGRKEVKTSKYNGVFKMSKNNGSTMSKSAKKFIWACHININGKRHYHIRKTEREAAICADKIYIEHGRYDLLNILKPKQ